MKNLFFLFVGLICCCCTAPQRYQQKINDIPLISPNYNADVRFKGEKMPSTPYLEVLDLDVVLNGKMDVFELRKKLEIIAIKEGVDAFVNVEFWDEYGQKVNLFTIMIDLLDDDMETTTVTTYATHVIGTGIIYVDNTQYIARQPEYEYIYKMDKKSDMPRPFLKIEYKPNGQVYMVYPEHPKAKDFYDKYFKYYTDFHLLKQREKWMYKLSKNKISKRIMFNDQGNISKIVIPEYDEKRKIKALKILHTKTSSRQERVFYDYDTKGKVIGKRIEVKDGTNIYETYQYQDADKPTGRKILVNIPGYLPIKLGSSYHYYDKNFLKNYYEQTKAAYSEN